MITLVPAPEPTACANSLQRYSHDPIARALMSQAVGVLGEQRARIIEEEMTVPAIRGLLAQAAERGLVRPVSIEIATRLALRQICEAAILIALSDDPENALADVEAAVPAMLDGL